MNSALFVLNAIAVAALLAFHVHSERAAEPVAYASTYQAPHQTAQLAVMSSQARSATTLQVATEQNAKVPVGPRTQSWVF